MRQIEIEIWSIYDEPMALRMLKLQEEIAAFERKS